MAEIAILNNDITDYSPEMYTICCCRYKIISSFSSLNGTVSYAKSAVTTSRHKGHSRTLIDSDTFKLEVSVILLAEVKGMSFIGIMPQ